MTADIQTLDSAVVARVRRRTGLLARPPGVALREATRDAVFQRALDQAGLDGLRVLALGVRSGETIAHILEACAVAHLTAGGFETRAAQETGCLLRRRIAPAAGRYGILAGGAALMDSPAARAAAAGSDAIVAEFAADQAAPAAEAGAAGATPYRRLGLGALDTLLEQCAWHAPQARLVVGTPGETGGAVLASLFAAHGYTAALLDAGLVAFDAPGELPHLVGIERAARRLPASERRGFADCELYIDARGEERINAADGWVLAQSGLGALLRRPWFVFDARLEPEAA